MDDYDLSRMSVAMWIDWRPIDRMSHTLRYFNCSNPGYVERSWRWFTMILAQKPGVSRESMGERGSNSFFAQNHIFYFLFSKTMQLWLASSILPAFLTLSFPLTVALGLNLQCLFTWNISHDVLSSTIFGRNLRTCAHSQMIGYVCSSHFPYTLN